MKNTKYKTIHTVIKTAQRYTRRYMPRYMPYKYEYKAEYQIILDNSRLKHKVGDIIQFNDFHNVVNYARNQFGVIVERYRWVKYKPERTYYDYGSIIIILSGNRQGKLRKFYMNTPWKKVQKDNEHYDSLKDLSLSYMKKDWLI